MMRPMGLRTLICLVLLTLAGPSSASAQAVSYTKDVHPILAERCYKCHGGEERKGGFSMVSRESFLLGGEFGPAVAPGKSAESLLVELVTSTDKDEWMPAKGDRLSPNQIAVLRAWIDDGLPWDAVADVEEVWKTPLYPREVKVPNRKGVHSSRHPIDRIMASYFRAKAVEPPPVVGDRRFVRRAYLDVTGLLPSPEAVEDFVQNRKRGKRARLVDDLLDDRRSYAEHWMTFWNDTLRNDFEGTGYIDGGRKQITRWLYNALYENLPYDQFVTQLIAPDRHSEGFINGIVWRGAQTANQQAPLQAARSVSQIFLGVNMKCASCHDSFVDDLKLADAYGLANAFSETELELVRCGIPTGNMADTKFLWPELGSVDGSAPMEDRRRQVAALVTSPENGRFTRTIANRIWAALMGRGLVEPLDSMDSEPWSADVLDWLANEFVDSGYDSQALIRSIMSAKTYQLESDARAPVGEDYVFAGPTPRRLTVEQFYDAMSCVTGVWQNDPKFSPRSREASASTESVRAWRVPADTLMRAMGRPNREQVTLAREVSFTRLQAIELTNGETLSAYVTRGAERLLESGQVAAEDLFMRALGRPPVPAEIAALGVYGAEIADREDVEDLLWTLFMHPEFQLKF